MLDRNSAVTRLCSLGWLAATPPAFRDAVVDRLGFHVFEKGQWIYRFGETGNGLWGVIEGGLQVEFTRGVHSSRTGVFAGAGFWIGEGSLIAREPRGTGLRATRKTQMAQLSQKAFLAIAAERPDAWRWIGLLTFFHLVSLIGLREDLCLREPEMRVIATLFRMCQPHWGGPGTGPDTPNERVTIDLSQSDLAELCNVSRAFLADLLATLKREGLVEPGYGCLHILSPEALRSRFDRHL